MADRAELLKLACRRPDGEKLAFRDVWTQESLRDAFVAATGVQISRSEVGRILRESEMRPHRFKVWLHSPDPDFTAKARRVCAAYVSPPPGTRVICVDEKTTIQALERIHKGRTPLPGRAGRREFEYLRHGTTHLLGAFDVATGEVYAQCVPVRGAVDLLSFMDGVAKRWPKDRILVVWDNLNIHHGPRWEEFSRRHGGRFSFVYTPLHASWLNQIELWFSILQRRVLRHGSFTSVVSLIERLVGFVSYWNAEEAHPFRWRFRGRFSNTHERRAA